MSNSGFSRRDFLVACDNLTRAIACGLLWPAANALARDSTDGRDREIVQLSAREMVARLRRRELSPVELIQAHIVRFAQIQPSINAVTHVRFAAALRQARDAERAILQDRVDWKSQPLFGLPFSVKNHIDVQGIPTTAGAPGWKGEFAQQDADVIRRLRATGAIPIAATNLSCLALSYESDNLLFGRTNNPYDLSRTVGGSSGGEGGLIAACGSPLGVGSDGNGSIRVPSAWNGIAGLRPSPGRLSLNGMQPPVDVAARDAIAIGPMCRAVRDIELALPFFLAGKRPEGVPPLRSSRDVRLRELRIRFLTKWNHGNGEPLRAIQEGVSKSARHLERNGAHVEEGLPDVLHRIGSVVVTSMLGSDNFSVSDFRETMADVDAESDAQLIAAMEWIERWQRTVPLHRQRKDAAAFAELREAFSSLMEDVDAIILPVHAEAAMKHGTAWPRDYDDHCEEKYSYCYFCRLVGQHPAGTVRVGTTEDGLPVGVQVIGRKYREDIVLCILGELEAEFGGWELPPEPGL